MANQLSEEKSKIIYAEYNDTRAVLDEVRKEMSRKEGREISEAEFFRRLTLDFANKTLKKKGKRPLDLDPTSLPGGITAAPRNRRVTRHRKAA